MGNSVKENLKIVRERIRSAAENCGRKPEQIDLVAVSKGQPVDKINEAWTAGLHVFAENRVQEWLGKAGQIEHPVDWHLIGRLQTNKAARVVGRVRLIQSVDSLHLIEKLESLATEKDQICSVLLQVNTSGESSKSGFHPEMVEDCL